MRSLRSLLIRSDLTIGGELEHDYISKVSPRKTQKNITGSLHEGFEGFYKKNYTCSDNIIHLKII